MSGQPMKNIHQTIMTGAAVVWSVLNRPKNLAKGPFNKDLAELFLKAEAEMKELAAEVLKKDYEKATYEAGDVCAYLFAFMEAAMEKAGMRLCMYEGKVCVGAETCENSVCACYDRDR